MITNANLISVSQPGESDRRGGGISYDDAVDVNKRCALIDPTNADRESTNARIASSTAVLIILRKPMQAINVPLVKRGRVVAQLDGGVSQTFEISEVSAPTKAGGLSHFKCWLTEVTP